VRETVIATCGLSAVTETVMAAIPGVDCAAVVVLGPAGIISAQAVRGDLPPVVMDLQNEIGQGPWLDAVTAMSQIRVRDIRTEGRWPLFCGRAAVLGALSMLCSPVTIGTSVGGSLCLISNTAATFGDQAGNLAAVFAEHAAIALAGAEIMEQMHESLSTRVLSGRPRGSSWSGTS
jgi:transcriptional regulator with GAF, ATPase, and Fis domain